MKMRKHSLLTILSVLLCTIMLFTGCTQPNADQPNNNNDDEQDANQGGQESTLAHFTDVIAHVTEVTGGETHVLYESDVVQSHVLETLTVAVDSYTLLDLTEIDADQQALFSGASTGGVLIAHYTIVNEGKQPVYYQPDFYLTYVGAPRALAPQPDLVPVGQQLGEKLNAKTDYALAAGETMTGYAAYALSDAFLAGAKDRSIVRIDIPVGQAEQGSFTAPIGKSGRLMLSIAPGGEEQTIYSQIFYYDRIVAEDMGMKKMIKAQQEINEQQTIGDVTITLDGYQFTDFIPKTTEEPRFANFPDGIVLVTVKFNIGNDSKADIGLLASEARLILNDGDPGPRSEETLLTYHLDDVIKAGETGEMLKVFVLDKKSYEHVWHDKAFAVEIGPLRDVREKELEPAQIVEFVLP